MNTLPSEIQDVILSYLEIDDCWRCCAVSPSWRSVILNWPGMWTSLTEWDNILLDPEAYRPYISESSVNHAYLVQSDSKELSAKVDFLISLKCTALKDVKLVGSHLRGTNMLKLVTAFGPTLSHVSVSLSGFSEELPVTNEGPDILFRHCPNLSTLAYIGSLPSEWTRHLVRHEHLTDLAMDMRNCDGDLDTEALLKATPKLQHLALTLANVSKDPLLPLKLHQNCPDLISLFLTSGMGEDMEYHTKRQTQLKGIDLTIFDPNDEYPVVASMMRNFTNNIRSLDLSGTYLVGETTMSYLSTTVFSSLTHLTIGLRNDDSNTNLSSFLANSVPNLKYLEIIGEVDPYDRLLACLGRHSRCLQEIHFGSHTISEDALVRFFHETSSLQRVNFMYSTAALTPELLYLIVTLGIQELQVNADEPFGSLTVDSIEQFLNTVRSAGKTLNSLKFSVHSCTDTAIFFDANKIKIFLEKLNSVANAWELVVIPAIEIMDEVENRTISTTHIEYRRHTV
ncbi:hypothetical protein BJV82DRAFT_589759 [Fennellomyces sp. T-0311]|nr:hypothetical protein BJV82DRAFT_589759 [Fennellomyces sp. T-0311]